MIESDLKVPAILKADKIFTYLHYNERVTQSKIVKDLNLPKATVSRLLKILTELRYLHLENKKYSLGEKFYFFSNKYEKYSLLKNISYPYLKELSLKFKETFKISVLDDNLVRSIASVESSDVIKISVSENAIFPLHAGAASKLLICQMETNKLRKLLGETLSKYTENTITNHCKLEEELIKINIKKISYDNMEHSNSIKAVAVPIYNKKNRIIGALSCPCFPKENLDEKFKIMIVDMRKVALNIEKRLIDFEK